MTCASRWRARAASSAAASRRSTRSKVKRPQALQPVEVAVGPAAGQVVEHHHLVPALHPSPCGVAADEARTTRHQVFHAPRGLPFPASKLSRRAASREGKRGAREPGRTHPHHPCRERTLSGGGEADGGPGEREGGHVLEHGPGEVRRPRGMREPPPGAGSRGALRRGLRPLRRGPAAWDDATGSARRLRCHRRGAGLRGGPDRAGSGSRELVADELRRREREEQRPESTVAPLRQESSASGRSERAGGDAEERCGSERG